VSNSSIFEAEKVNRFPSSQHRDSLSYLSWLWKTSGDMFIIYKHVSLEKHTIKN